MNARTAPHCYLHIASGNWQWRIEDVADVEIRHAVTHEVIRTLTPAQVVLMSLHYDLGAEIVAELLYQPRAGVASRKPLASAPARAALPPAVVGPIREVREARRLARAKNSTHKGRKRRARLPP